MSDNKNKIEIVQTYEQKTSVLQEKSKEVEKKSDMEKQELSSEIETTLQDLKKDLEILDVTTDSTERTQLLNFQTQLTSMKGKVEASAPVSAPSGIEKTPTTSENKVEEKGFWDKTKDMWNE
jgi:hypothetical protein